MGMPGAGAEVTIPDQTLTALVLRHADRLAEKPALVDGVSGEVLSYEELATAIHETAEGLRQYGFKAGDVLALYAPNSPYYAVVFHAVALLGGVNTTINPLYTAEELSFQLRDSGARFLVSAQACLATARAAMVDSDVESLIAMDGEAGHGIALGQLRDYGELSGAPAVNPATDRVVLPYSSGTTGLPKGVMLSHRNLVANLCQVEGCPTISPTTEDDVVLGILPFFHIYGMLVVMNLSLYRGATVVTLPRFELEGFLACMQNYRVTLAYLVPPIILALANHPAVEDYDLSSLRRILSGAAPLGGELLSRVQKRLGCAFVQGYGLTETSPVTHIGHEDSARTKPASIGPPLPNTEVLIVDPDSGTRAPVGERGEVWIRGPQVMQGYLNNPEATREVIDAEGWFHSGDIGYVDVDGDYYIVDRLKELIKYKGYQVAPAELEAVLLHHPAVSDAAVIGIPDEEAGELPKAFVVCRDPVSAEEVMDHVAAHVAPYKRIREVAFVEQIPKAPSGKILRRLLREH